MTDAMMAPEEIDVYSDVEVPLIPIRRVASVNAGQSPPSEDYNDEGDGPPFLQGNAEFGVRHPKPDRYCPTATKRCDPGSVLLSVRAPVGALNIADQTFGLGRGLCAIRPNPGQLADSYLFYAMHVARHPLQARASGSTYDSVSSRDVKSLRIPLPNKQTQEVIADFLDEKTARIDELIEDKKRLIDRLEEAQHSLIHSRVTQGLTSNVSTTDTGIPWIGRVPEHWDTKKLRYATECLDRRRIPLNASERADMQGQYPYWGANGIVDYVDDWLFDEELVLLGEDGAPFFDPKKPVARVVSGKIWVNNHAHILRADPDTDPRFLAYALNAVDYADYIKGSTRDKLVQAEMNEIRLPAPPVKEQSKIADVLDDECGEIDGLIDDLEEQISSVQEYRTSLITAAVTGQIDVRASTRAVA